MPPKPMAILQADDGKSVDAGPARPLLSPPRRQGQLDALCGIYAIINAFAYASRDQPLRYFPTKRLFMHLIEAATWQRGDTSFIGDGLTHAELKHLCKKAVRFHRKQGYEFRLMSPKALLPDHPYPKNPEDAESRAAWFARAASLPAAAIILDINTDWISHWSVLSGIRSDRLALYDSNGMQSVAAINAGPFFAITRSRAKPS